MRMTLLESRGLTIAIDADKITAIAVPKDDPEGSTMIYVFGDPEPFVVDGPFADVCRAVEAHGEHTAVNPMPGIWKRGVPAREGYYLVYAPGYVGGTKGSKENRSGVMFSLWRNGKWSVEVGPKQQGGIVLGYMEIPRWD